MEKSVAEAKKSPKKRQLKPASTVREKAESSSAPKKARRFGSAKTKAGKPLRKAANVGRKEYYLPLPDNRTGRFLNKRRSWVPKYFREAWHELKKVTWPGRKETAKLTFAVFMFAAFFMIFITAIDFVLDKIFKQLILK